MCKGHTPSTDLCRDRPAPGKLLERFGLLIAAHAPMQESHAVLGTENVGTPQAVELVMHGASCIADSFRLCAAPVRLAVSF